MMRPDDAKPPRLLEGKTAVVTGAGSGVGRAMAEIFSLNGAAVLVVDVVQARVDQAVSELESAGQWVEGLALDLSVKDGPDKMVQFAEKSIGGIDVLCNNAGIMDGVFPVTETTDEVWDKVMDVNLNAPFRACRRAIPVMLKNGGGTILNTASVAGLFGGLAGAAYTTSKHGLIGLTKSIAAHYGPRGIRCNAMVLGGVKTNIGVGSASPDPRGMEHLMKSASLMPKMAEPMEIAELALFLASANSSFMNGSCVVIDGGWSVL